MDIQIEQIQKVLEWKLSELPSVLHRFQCDDCQYWYHVGRFEAYEEMLNLIEKEAKLSQARSASQPLSSSHCQ